jgi:hypothetical protein
METNITPGQILYIQSTENFFYISIMRNMQPHPVVGDDNRYEIDTCCDLCVDVYNCEMYPSSITFARGGNSSIWDLDIEFDEVRPAHDFEKKMLFDRLVYTFKLHNPKWMHLTDSTYFDILDWLSWEFDVDVNDEANPDTPLGETISEIQDYIWEALCKETGNYQEETAEPEMVNKAKFIEKTISYFTPILKTYCSEECVKELIDGFVNSLGE